MVSICEEGHLPARQLGTAANTAVAHLRHEPKTSQQKANFEYDLSLQYDPFQAYDVAPLSMIEQWRW